MRPSTQRFKSKPMELLSKALVSQGFRDQLKRDLARATVCRFLVAYISHDGLHSIGRDLLLAALRDSRSFGVSSLTCAFGYEPLLRLQQSLGEAEVRLKYFMDPLIYEPDELNGLALFHSKLVFLAMERERKAVVYIGSHNWTRRAIGPRGSRNAEASLRIEMEFDVTALNGTGTGLASDVNGHLLQAYQLAACLPATTANRLRFEQWLDRGCRNAPRAPLEGNTIVLAVRKDDGTTATPAQWAELKGKGIYLQALDEKEGARLYDNTSQVLVLVWLSEVDLQAGDQPIILQCRGTTQKAGPNSLQASTNQSTDPIVGFGAIIFDDRQLAAMKNGDREAVRRVSIWSGRPSEVFDFEFPASRSNASQVDEPVRPNYQYHLEVEHIVFPEDGGRPEDADMVWGRESFAVVNKPTDAPVKRAEGYLVTPEEEAAIKKCLVEQLFLNLETARVLPISSFDPMKVGKRLGRHPLHEAYWGPKAKLKHPDYYANLPPGTLIAIPDDLAAERSRERQPTLREPVKRVLRVFTMPLIELQASWKHTARSLGGREPLIE
jgi:hypothetical protein